MGISEKEQYDLGNRISNVLEERKIQIKDFAEAANTILGYKNVQSASEYIRRLCKGWIYGLSTSEKATNEYNLIKTARVLFLLGIPPNGSLINTIKKIDNRFVYPPPDSDRILQYITKLPLGSKISLLKKEDKKHIDEFVNERITKNQKDSFDSF